MALTLKPQLLFDTFGGINRQQCGLHRSASGGGSRPQKWQSDSRQLPHFSASATNSSIAVVVAAQLALHRCKCRATAFERTRDIDGRRCRMIDD